MIPYIFSTYAVMLLEKQGKIFGRNLAHNVHIGKRSGAQALDK